MSRGRSSGRSGSSGRRGLPDIRDPRLILAVLLLLAGVTAATAALLRGNDERPGPTRGPRAGDCPRGGSPRSNETAAPLDLRQRPGATAGQGTKPPPQPVVGIHARLRSLPATQVEANARVLRRYGFTHAREDFTWAEIEPRPGVWCWSRFDNLVAATARADLRLVAILNAPPRWATPTLTAPPVSQRARGAYAEFARRVVERYGSRGTFWERNPSVPRKPVQYFDVWNEPYVAASWGDGLPDPAGYARMFSAVVQAARAADPDARFMLEADVSVLGRPDFMPYLEPLLAALPNVAEDVDVVSVHPYALDGSGPGTCPGGTPAARRSSVCRLLDIRRVVNAHGGSAIPIWITEIGWSTAPRADGAVDDASQAAYTRELSELLRGRWRRTAEGVLWYAFSTPEASPSRREDWFGLVHPDGAPKPAWRGLVAEMAGRRRP